jgi:hypothetical protein
MPALTADQIDLLEAVILISGTRLVANCVAKHRQQTARCRRSEVGQKATSEALGIIAICSRLVYDQNHSSSYGVRK